MIIARLYHEKEPYCLGDITRNSQFDYWPDGKAYLFYTPLEMIHKMGDAFGLDPYGFVIEWSNGERSDYDAIELISEDYE